MNEVSYGISVGKETSATQVLGLSNYYKWQWKGKTSKGSSSHTGRRGIKGNWCIKSQVKKKFEGISDQLSWQLKPVNLAMCHSLLTLTVTVPWSGMEEDLRINEG